jgi:hypothetical protein
VFGLFSARDGQKRSRGTHRRDLAHHGAVKTLARRAASLFHKGVRAGFESQPSARRFPMSQAFSAFRSLSFALVCPAKWPLLDLFSERGCLWEDHQANLPFDEDGPGGSH